MNEAEYQRRFNELLARLQALGLGDAVIPQLPRVGQDVYEGGSAGSRPNAVTF